jgi:hypothetical protein
VRYTAPTSPSMADEADQILHATDESVVTESRSDFRMESDSPAMSTSSNAVAVKIEDKTVPNMSDYWKKTMITEANRQAYHSTGWLTGGLESSVPEIDVSMVDGSTVVYFESHLVAGLGLPPSKFIVAIKNFLGCELVHFNLNAITALSYFTMLCECWLGIAPDTSLFWYFYSPARYDKVIYSKIRLSPPSKGIYRCHLQEFLEGFFPKVVLG